MSSDWRYHVQNIGFLTNSWKQYGFSSSDNLSKGKWNQNFTVSERCSVSHRLWQYLSPRCMQKRVPHLWQFIKFTNFLTWRHHRQHYECMTHNLHNNTSAPINLQNIVCVALVLLSLSIWTNIMMQILFICTLHHLIIIIVHTYLKIMNL